MGYRSKTNAVILLDMCHILWGEHAWEKKGKEKKPKLEIG
jgi:hypothetical protein